MTGSISILPSTMDVGFIVAKAGLTNNYGFEYTPDGIKFVYPVACYDVVMAAIVAYDTDYLPILLPKKLSAIDEQRKIRAKAFNFMGMEIVLDTTTIANLTGAVIGLDREPGRAYINWQVGLGKFVTIPRQMMYMLADAAFSYFQACFDRSMALTAQAKAATTIAELESIDINSGWPVGVPVPVPPAPEEPETPPADPEEEEEEEPETPPADPEGEEPPAEDPVEPE